MTLRNRYSQIILMLLTLFWGSAISAQSLVLMQGVVPRQDNNQIVEGTKFKKKGPWKIGMSHFGQSNSWAIQMANDSEHEASKHPNISKFLFRDAGLNQSKQFLDINQMLDEGIDALIVTPLTPNSAEAGIKRAISLGVPVIVHTGRTKSNNYTVEIEAGGKYFGKVMGEWLVRELPKGGGIWVLRGVYSHPEDIARYEGLLEALRNTNVKIKLGGYGDWNYKGGKVLCESLYELNPDVQGIWSSGADMARACINVFKSHGAKIPPITGEGNNGFFKLWKSNNLRSIAPEYGPELGAAGVRAAVAILEGASLYKQYVYNPEPITESRRDLYLREDLLDEYWFPTSLTEEKKRQQYAIKK